MLFGGTAVVQGSCVAVVTDIGMNTEMGKIQAGPPIYDIHTRIPLARRRDRGKTRVSRCVIDGVETDDCKGGCVCVSVVCIFS